MPGQSSDLQLHDYIIYGFIDFMSDGVWLNHYMPLSNLTLIYVILIFTALIQTVLRDKQLTGMYRYAQSRIIEFVELVELVELMSRIITSIMYFRI